MPLPYPEPRSEAVSRVMRANRKTDTGPERRLRSALHRLGLRYRVGIPLLAGPTRVRPDVVFTRASVAIFVDGCYWHSCPEHATSPRFNAAYWLPKLARNVERDRANDAALAAAGWRVLRVWEHEDSVVAAGAIAEVVTSRVPVLRRLESQSWKDRVPLCYPGRP